MGENKTFSVIISSKLNVHQEGKLLQTLKMHKNALGWTTANIKGISPLICTHRIYLEENAKPSRGMQRRLNPNMKEVVRNEVIKLLDNRIIYPISDSKWVSPTQVVPKKSGVTMITNEKIELIPIRTIKVNTWIKSNQSLLSAVVRLLKNPFLNLMRKMMSQSLRVREGLNLNIAKKKLIH